MVDVDIVMVQGRKGLWVVWQIKEVQQTVQIHIKICGAIASSTPHLLPTLHQFFLISQMSWWVY